MDKIEAQEGDVFRFQLDESHYAYGQIVALDVGPNPMYIAIFERTTSGDKANLDEILSSNIIILTHTQDAKIWHGHWEVIANIKPSLEKIPFPCYKFGTDEVYVEDYSGKRRRLAVEKESDILDYRFSVAPIRIENATKAHLGYDDWKPSYEKLTYEHVVLISDVKI